jgi:predicted peptidase
MRKTWLTLPGLLLAGLFFPESMKAQDAPKQTAQTLNRSVTQTQQLKYWLFLPKGYAAKETKRWPLLVFLHGMRERGDNLELVKKHGPAKTVEQQPDFPFILVSPQCPADRWWPVDAVSALIDEVMEKHAVDAKRVYLTGLSMGFATWELGLKTPERFAAIAPICGGGNPFPPFGFAPKRAEALKSMGIWAFHGGKDPVVKLAESERMVQAMKIYGCSDVELTLYPEAGHDSWTETYNNPKLYEWFLKHTR